MNPEKKKLEARKWYLEHSELTKKRADKWQKDNPQKRDAINRKWRLSNPGKVTASKLRWYKNNLDKARESAREWSRRNRENGIQRGAARKARLRNLPNEDCSRKIKLLQKITRFCHWCCRFITPEEVTIDHVIPLRHGGNHVNDNLVGCCAWCNSSKADKSVHEWLPTITSR